MTSDIALYRRVYEIYLSRDWNSYRKVLTPDVVVTSPLAVTHGIQARIDADRAYGEIWESRVTHLSVFSADGMVAAELIYHGTYRPELVNGQEVSEADRTISCRMVDIAKTRDGRFESWSFMYDTRQLVNSVPEPVRSLVRAELARWDPS